MFIMPTATHTHCPKKLVFFSEFHSAPAAEFAANFADNNHYFG